MESNQTLCNLLVALSRVLCLASLLFLGASISGCRNKPPANAPDTATETVKKEETGDELAANSDSISDTETPSKSVGESEGRDQPPAQSPASENLSSSDANSTAVAESEASQAPSWISEGSWTEQRLVALGNTGPTIIDLHVSIGKESLEASSDAVVELIADQLFEDMEEPVSWEQLIEHPLVKSGWLGNLIPEEDQVDQLIGMYDAEADKTVSTAELKPFLSRGLSRNRPLLISDIGTAPGADTTASPWGAFDANQDYSLDSDELAKLAGALEQFDYNGDSIISILELNEAQNMTQPNDGMNQMGGSMLDTTSLMFPVFKPDDDDSSRQKTKTQFSRRILERYTFSIDIPRDTWSNWTDSRWKKLDADQDGVLNRQELEAILDIAADTHVYLRLPGLEMDAGEDFLVHGDMGHSGGGHWSSTSTGGKHSMASFIGNFQILDSYTEEARELLRSRLASALKQPNLQAFFTGQLQLQEGAFDLVDVNEDEELDDEEFERVWQWLSSRQGARMVVRWMLHDRPWFEILDQNGDQRLTEVELSQGKAKLISLDSNEDGLLTPNEMPLIVRLECDRSDNRLQLNQLFGMNDSPDTPAPDTDWFGAMDTNRDGFLASEEFFGDSQEFAASDKNQDGFLSRSEVYEP